MLYVKKGGTPGYMKNRMEKEETHKKNEVTSKGGACPAQAWLVRGVSGFNCTATASALLATILEVEEAFLVVRSPAVISEAVHTYWIMPEAF